MVVYKVSIPNWTKYNPRSDVKACSWFRFESNFLDSVNGHCLTNDQIVTWLFILSARSKVKTDEIKFTSRQAEFVIKTTAEELEQNLAALQQADMINFFVTRNAYDRTRNVDVTDAGTDVPLRTDETDETDGRTNVNPTPSELINVCKESTALKVPKKVAALGDLWNEVIGSTTTLKKVIPKRFAPMRVKAISAALVYEQNLEVWRNVFSLVAESDFLTGRVKAWQASFDWVIRPENAAKIVEGVYENKIDSTPQQKPTRYVTIEELQGDAS